MPVHIASSHWGNGIRAGHLRLPGWLFFQSPTTTCHENFVMLWLLDISSKFLGCGAEFIFLLLTADKGGLVIMRRDAYIG